jgi:hypothetical protein
VQRGTYSRQGEPLPTLQGYTTDPVAQLDAGELRYAWFDRLSEPPPPGDTFVPRTVGQQR